jgi:predicted NBD/HSP70 family sugar kinase
VSRTRINGASENGAGRGVAAEELRRHNLALVLDRLHVSGAVSRSELTASTGLNRSTIGDLIGELGALGLVEEGPAAAATGPGRPSSMVRPRPEGATALAVELTVDSIAIASVGIGGHVFDQVRVPRPRRRSSPERTLDAVEALARPMLADPPAGRRPVAAGVAVAGVTRRADGFVHLAPNLDWHDVPLAALLGGRLDLEVMVANDADLGALAEHRRGAGVGIGHLIFVGGEMGIGAGMIVGGEPMLGSAGYAGEAGHMLVNPTGWRCRCGAIGCWETEAGEAALMRRAGHPRSGGLRAMDALSRRAEAGEPVATAALAETARWLGLGIATLVNLFNPELVILGGMYHRFFSHLQPTVGNVVRARALAMPASQVEVVQGALGADAPLIGAAELALSALIEDPAGDGRHDRIEAR